MLEFKRQQDIIFYMLYFTLWALTFILY